MNDAPYRDEKLRAEADQVATPRAIAAHQQMKGHAPFPAFFAAWVFDEPIGEYATTRMLREWRNEGLIVDAEEGYAPTTKGRDAARAIAEISIAHLKAKVEAVKAVVAKRSAKP